MNNRRQYSPVNARGASLSSSQTRRLSLKATHLPWTSFSIAFLRWLAMFIQTHSKQVNIDSWWFFRLSDAKLANFESHQNWLPFTLEKDNFLQSNFFPLFSLHEFLRLCAQDERHAEETFGKRKTEKLLKKRKYQIKLNSLSCILFISYFHTPDLLLFKIKTVSVLHSPHLGFVSQPYPQKANKKAFKTKNLYRWK